jgi:putative serine protease PepD
MVLPGGQENEEATMSTENNDARQGQDAPQEQRPAVPQSRPQADPTGRQPAQSGASPAPAQPPVEHPTERLAVHDTAPLPRPVQEAPAPQPTQTGGPRYGQHTPYGTDAPQQPGQQHGQQPDQHPAQHPAHHPAGHQQAPGRPEWGSQQQPAAHHDPSNPYLHPDAPAAGARTTTRERRPRAWVPVASAAVIAALLASGGTAALVSGLDDDGASTSIAAVGRSDSSDAAPVEDSTAENPDWQAVTAAVAPSVVAIQVSSQQGGSEGSGLVIDDAGHVLTNNHVVSGAANGTVQVTLSDGRLFEATIVGTDPSTDLAVVQIQDAPDDLQPVAMGDSDAVQVGDPVLAVGNPLGLANTATTGIVSALDRPVSATGEDATDSVVTNAIQVDAAINPGNSGGPLFNASGQVIGITSSIATLSSGTGGQSGSIGLGFAIPVNLAKNISGQLIENGSAQHAFLGVTMSDGTATADGVTRRGAQVQDVTPGSPAAEAGLRSGDVIVAIDDEPVNGAESLTAFVRERTAGQESTLTVVRGSSAEQVKVTFAVREETSNSSDQGGSGQGSDQGSGQQAPQPGSGEDGSSGGSGSGDSLWEWLFGGDS